MFYVHGTGITTSSPQVSYVTLSEYLNTSLFHACFKMQWISDRYMHLFETKYAILFRHGVCVLKGEEGKWYSLRFGWLVLADLASLPIAYHVSFISFNFARIQKSIYEFMCYFVIILTNALSSILKTQSQNTFYF